MDTICANDIKLLLQNGEGVHVSIVMPTHHKGGADQQDLIRFKNLLRLAEEKLVKQGLRAPEAKALLKPAESLLTDNLFWRQQGESLALFLETNRFFYYRLPIALQEGVEVGQRFFIRPLVPVMGKCGLYYVLAVSQNENRLLQCTLSGSVRVNIPDVPKSMADIMKLEGIPERNVRYHGASTPGPLGGGSPVQAPSSSTANINKDHILPYFEQLNTGIMKVLKLEQSPMVLAGVDFLHPIYRKANTYQNLLPQGVLGNPEEMSDTALCRQAWPIIDAYFDKDRVAALDEYRKVAGTGLTVYEAKDILEVSKQGRIRFLFVSENLPVRAKITDAGPEDLVDQAIYETLKRGGTIYEIKPEEMPEKAATLAILRY